MDACALNGFTPLHVACKKNRFEMVKFLIEKNANTTISTESGLTALMVAAYVDKAGFQNSLFLLVNPKLASDWTI